MRLLLAIPVFLVATLFFLGGISQYSLSGSKLSNESIQRTIDKNIAIDKVLRSSAVYVDEFYSTNKRFPTSAEYKSWANEQPKSFYQPSNIRIFSNGINFPSDVIDRFGKPRDGSYVLALWRGEWNEYYVSWKNKTTLSFDTKDYEFSLGSFLFMMTTSLFIYFLSAVLGSRRLQTKLKYLASKLASNYLSQSTYENIARFSYKSKQYIKVILGWASVGILLGLLIAVGGGVGPGSYIIWLGIIGFFIVLSVIHCIVILGYKSFKSKSGKGLI